MCTGTEGEPELVWVIRVILSGDDYTAAWRGISEMIPK